MNEDNTLLQGVREMAQAVFLYYSELNRMGLDKKTALTLTLAFIQTIKSNN